MAKRSDGQSRELAARADRLYSTLLGADSSRVRDELAAGWDPNTCDLDGRNLLITAAAYGHTELVAHLLADRRCDPSCSDSRGLSALHLVAMHDHAALVEVLIAAGAQVDAKDRWGNTPLNSAVYYYQPNNQGRLILALLAAGADPDVANDYGWSPRSLAHEIANTDVRKFFDPSRPA